MDLKIGQVVEELKKKKADDLDFTVQKKDVKVLNGGTVINLRGKEYEMGDVAKTTLCKLLGIPKHYFKRYPVHTEFSEHANTLLESKPLEDILIRSRGDGIRACLTPKYSIYDNDRILEDLQQIEGNLPEYKLGILRDDAVNSTFMLTFGKALVEKDQTFPMLRFSNSEVGLSNLNMEMGLFRLVCSNGLVKRAADTGYITWEHSPRNVHKVHTFINFVVDKGIIRWSSYQQQFEASREVNLSRPFLETARDLVNRNLVTQKFANRLIEVDEATPVQNLFDVINAVTKTAQNEKTWAGQTKYENLSSVFLDRKIIC